MGPDSVRRGFQPVNILRHRQRDIQRENALVETIKRIAFKFIAKSAIAIYSRFPVFGDLRASLAVIRQNGLILVIDRNDGRGYSFPGGLSGRGESAEQSMRREVKEETGLDVGQFQLLFEYRTAVDVPCLVTVFEASASGSLAGSWEGTPRWVSPAETSAKILASQAEVIRRISL